MSGGITDCPHSWTEDMGDHFNCMDCGTSICKTCGNANFPMCGCIGGGMGEMYCPLCGNFGHMDFECPQNIYCTNCGQMGHYDYECGYFEP